MIDEETGKHYVIRLRHKPSGEYFRELETQMHTGPYVVLDKSGDRIFTTASQMGKLWSRVEQLKIDSEKFKDLSHETKSDSAHQTIDKISSAADRVISLMDNMELEICYLQPALEKQIEDKFRQEVKIEQANGVFLKRFGSIVHGAGDPYAMYCAFLLWEKMINREKWTSVIKLEKAKDLTYDGILNTLKDLAIEIHVFDPDSNPRLIAITEEDVNLIRLTNKNIIKNSFSVSEALKLKAAIFEQFGLSITDK